MKFRKIKSMIALSLCLTLLSSSFAFAEATDPSNYEDITVTLNSLLLTFDVEPYVNEDDRTMVEVRDISEALGAEVSWDGDTRTVTIEKDGSTIQLTIDAASYTKDGLTATMDTEAVIVNSSTMVPVRFLAEALGQTVEWDSVKKVVRLSNENQPTYTIVTTGQADAYDNEGIIISPSEGEDFYGQDAQHSSAEFSFTLNDDGTTTDNTTGLIWQTIPIDEKFSYEEAVAYCESLELAGYDDWRIPTTKELYSTIDYTTGWPFLDQYYFEFPAGESEMDTAMDGGPQGGGPQGDSTETMPEIEGADKAAGAALADSADNEATEGDNPPPPPSDESSDDGSISKAQGQFWADYYEAGTTHGGMASAFGVNHATGHIKAYPAEPSGEMGKYVRAVRGSEDYGVNAFVDNGDGTVSDEATGLMWMQDDAGMALEWKEALAFADTFEFAGYDDWRLPDIKELQSIVDYSGVYPAIDDSYFNYTVLEANEFYYFWSSTSAYFSTELPGNGYAWYVAFGYAVDNEGEDTHGAGAVRFSPKYTESSFAGEGGDNIFNSVRLVRTSTD